MSNPYEPPKVDCDPVRAPSDTQHPCPKCGGAIALKARYTWWGGAVGPKLFHVVRCQACKTQYNGKTGKGLRTVIIVYNLIAIVVFGTAAFWWWSTYVK